MRLSLRMRAVRPGPGPTGTTASRTRDTADLCRQGACPAGEYTHPGEKNRVLLLLGFASAFRCSELVGLDVADVAVTGTYCRGVMRGSRRWCE